MEKEKITKQPASKSVAAKKTSVKKTTAKQETAKETSKKSTRKQIFTKDMTLGEVLMKKPEAQAILFGFGMHCFGCPVTQFETLEEAAMMHDVDLKLLLKKLNEN